MFILRLIPEPYATIVVVAAISLAYLYGNVTGKGSERTRNAVEQLTRQNIALTKDLIDGSRLQQEIAQEASDARGEIELLKVRGARLEQYFKDKSSGCYLSPAERLRIEQYIRGER